MKKLILLSLSVIFLLILFGCASADNPKVVEINHRTYLLSDYKTAFNYCRCLMLQQMADDGLTEEKALSDPELSAEYYKKLSDMTLEQLKLKTVAEKEFEAEGLKLSPSDEELLEQFKKQFESEEAYKDYLKNINMSESEYKEILALQQEIQQLMDYCIKNGVSSDKDSFSATIQQRVDDADVNDIAIPSSEELIENK